MINGDLDKVKIIKKRSQVEWIGKRIYSNSSSLPSIILICNSQRTLRNRNKQNGLKSTKWQAWPFDSVKANFCFLKGLLRWLTVAKDVFRSSHWLEQNSPAFGNPYSLHLPSFVKVEKHIVFDDVEKSISISHSLHPLLPLKNIRSQF